ncbi:Ribonuclease HII [Caldibacillus debilis]|uniref:Ribonuclease HII n=1 Tax=Caldibacillus debilis TaxID=301148 RepID=A0A150LB07_9BACI|nr:Ribonuclease HII [Caldibacillus debilis]
MPLARETIRQIWEKLQSVEDENDPFLLACAEDERKGVRQLLSRWKREKEKRLKEKELFEKMCVFEKQLRQEGFQMIAGIDEAGRGPLAGPVVGCAVILPEDFYLPGINDSKKLTPQMRNIFEEQIRKEAVAVGIGIVHAPEIDRLNIYRAAKKAMAHAVAQLSVFPDHLLIDAMEIDVPVPQTKLIKGDARSVSIAAASIVAKVCRDRMMIEYSKKYPMYHFDKNMGYATEEHLQALRKYGPSPLHRRSFAPVKDLIEGS